MLWRGLRRAALDTRCSLPPSYLLPWTANLTTTTQLTPSSALPPTSLPTSQPSAIHQSTNPSSPPPSPPNNLNPVALAAPHLPERSTPPPPSLSPSIRTLLPLLLAQRQIYIKSHIHARPYLLTQGDMLRLPFRMPGVQPGDILRLDRASLIGSRDFTLRAPGVKRRGKSATAGSERLLDMTPARAGKVLKRRVREGLVAQEEAERAGESAGAEEQEQKQAPEPFVPHLAKGTMSYLDPRLFVCRAVVMGTESEPMRVMEKTKRRQRYIRHVKSKHKYTVLRIKEVRVRSVEEIESGKEE